VRGGGAKTGNAIKSAGFSWVKTNFVEAAKLRRKRKKERQTLLRPEKREEGKAGKPGGQRRRQSRKGLWGESVRSEKRGGGPMNTGTQKKIKDALNWPG